MTSDGEARPAPDGEDRSPAALPSAPSGADRRAVASDREVRRASNEGVRRTWRATVFTLFPEMFPGPLGHSLAGRALERGIWSLEVHNIRDAGHGRHRSVDDTPFGGGAGMVMRPDVLDAALAGALGDVAGDALDGARSGGIPNDDTPDGAAGGADGRPLIYLTPRGRPLSQDRVRRLAAGPGAVLLCGRYEGVDQRFIEARGAEECSIGDYVLSGGELPALVLLDACVRLLPGVMGAQASGEEESFSAGLLEYPHYTRPAEWRGRRVPDVLLSGDHAAIAAWRRARAEEVTRERRPDLWHAHTERMDSARGAP